MPWKTSSSVILILIAAGFFIWQSQVVKRSSTTWQRFFRDDFKLPRGGETKTEQVTIDNESKKFLISY